MPSLSFPSPFALPHPCAPSLAFSRLLRYETLEPGQHVGPGGLDPAEVFPSLPKELQEAFGERSVEALRAVLEKMDPNDASYHMQRCIDSGLWDPQGGSASSDE